MKIRGKKTSIRKEPVVFPRTPEDVVIWVQSVDDFEDFDKKFKLPEPDEYKTPDGTIVRKTDSPEYKASIAAYAKRHTYWMFLKSLDCPENEIEWEEVDLDKPETWEKVPEELADFGLCDKEAGYLMKKIAEVNALDDTYLEAARKDFLAQNRPLEKVGR